MIGYDVAHLAIHVARLAVLDTLLQTIISCLNKFPRTFAHLSHTISLVEISVESILEHANINVDDVSFLQRSRVGDSVANYFVD
jgi:uncharacterized protein YoxC